MRIYALAIAFLIGINAEAQVIRAEPFYTAPESGVTNLLLDDYPGAAVAYSLRKLDKDYTGSAIRVRRSNNAEQDIGFLASGYLDTAALKTFVGTGATDSAMIVTWYNQADSSGIFGVKNLSQSTASNQPKIMRGGAIVRNVDGAIGLYADGNQWLTISNSTATMKFMHDGTKTSVFSVQQLGTISDPNNVYGIFGNNQRTTVATGNTLFYDDRASISRSDAIYNNTTYSISNQFIINGNSQNVITPNDVSLISVLFDPSNATAADRYSLFINGGSALKTNADTNTPTSSNATYNFQVMACGNNSSPLAGYMKEFVLYNSDQTSNRTAIRNNINSFYSIY